MASLAMTDRSEHREERRERQGGAEGIIYSSTKLYDFIRIWNNNTLKKKSIRGGKC